MRPESTLATDWTNNVKRKSTTSRPAKLTLKFVLGILWDLRNFHHALGINKYQASKLSELASDMANADEATVTENERGRTMIYSSNKDRISI